jgi:hypothetical protein
VIEDAVRGTSLEVIPDHIPFEVVVFGAAKKGATIGIVGVH